MLKQPPVLVSAVYEHETYSNGTKVIYDYEALEARVLFQDGHEINVRAKKIERLLTTVRELIYA